MVIILFGVSGAGKTTIGRLLAADLGWKFYDGDQFHSASNIEKMRRGVALTDADRQPWLDSLRTLIMRCIAAKQDAVLACSALRETYRRYLRASSGVKLVYLKAAYSLIEERLRARHEHFMDPALLRSQFETLEPPQGDAVEIEAEGAPEELVARIRGALQI
jgi:gluconokinase